MKIKLKNIGNIGTAEIDINGITVVAGENGTGKSTVGRALYTFFSSFYDYKKQIKESRIYSVRRALMTIESEAYEYNLRTRELAERIIRDAENGVSIGDAYMVDLLRKQMNNKIDAGTLNDQISNTVFRVKNVLKRTDEEILKAIVKNGLDEEFYNQPLNVNTTENGEIKINIKSKETNVLFDGSQTLEISNPVSLRTRAVYIDDPFVIDDIDGIRQSVLARRGLIRNNHKTELMGMLYQPSKQGLIDEINVNEHFETIYNLISTVCDGEVVNDERNTAWIYRSAQNKQAINIQNLSAGMKSFVMLKMLLMNGALEYNGTIIMDEPEIHLHPEWQLIFAEMIVLLQKEFQMHILLNTHSPYFLRAIEVFAARHEIADMCNFYMSEKEGDLAKIIDVTDNTDRIYAKLSDPLQKLENLRWNDD